MTAFDAKVTAAQEKASASADANARAQTTAADRVAAANVRQPTSSEASAAKVEAANRRAAESMRGFADASESSAARTGASLAGLATKGVPLAVGAIAVLTGKMAGDYQSALTRLSTTAGESQANLAMVGQGMLDMAGQVGISAQELAKGIYTVDSANIHGADSLTVLRAAAEGARQENADLSHVVDAVTTSLHDYHLPASDAAKVTSELIAAVSHGKTTFDDLTGAMHSIEPVAVGANMNIAQTAGALAAMTASGMHADQAAQNLAHTIGSFQTATKPMQEEFAQLGLSTLDLQSHLGDRGIAGTLQIVSDAIVRKMGPAGQIALSAINQNKVAIGDLSTMLGAMPPQLADLATGLLAGTTSQKEFRKAAQDLGGTAGTMADQFLASYKGADGFSAALKSGGPMVQTYIGALAKATGTADGLRTALMLTGQNAGSTNDAIAAVGKAAADTKGNIQGWSEVQGNFNQKLADAGSAAGKLAIEVGQHVLPVLSSMAGWVASDGIPGIEHLGGAISAAVGWFMQLPGPVKEAAVALGVIKVLGASDMFAGLMASGRVLAAGFANDMSNMVASARAGAGQMTAAFAEAKAAQRELMATRFGIDTSMLPRATGDIAGLGAAAGAAAKGGLAALKSGAMGLMGLFGGPWGVALIGATVGVGLLMDAVAKHDAEVKKATDDVLAWNKAVFSDPGGGAAVNAQQHLADLRKQIDDITTAIHNYNGAASGDTSGAGVYGLIQKQKELQGELDKGTAAWKAQLDAMTPVEEAQTRVDAATAQLAKDQKDNSSSSQILSNDAMRLQEAQHLLAAETALANAATKTQAQLQQDAANAMLGALDASRASEMANLQLSDAVDQYNKDVADGQHTTRQLKEEQLGLVSSAEQAAKAASDHAVAQDKANGITDTAHDAQVAFLKSLQDSANQMSGPAKQAILDMIAQLGKQQSQAVITSGAISALGVTVTDLPSEHLVRIDAPTQQQEDDLHQLGYVTTHLPNGQVLVTADTHPALTEIQDLLNFARQQSITFRAGLAVTNPLPGTSQRMGTYAEGGYTGAGSKYTPAGIVHAGEIVFSQADVARHGGVAAVEAMRTMRGYAAGGIVIPVGIDPGSLAAMRTGVQGLAQQAGAAATAASLYNVPVNPLGNVQLGLQMATAHGWGSMAEWSALYSLWQRESGWRNTAQNPTSTAYGIPQFLDSTWATVGVRKTSDPGTQIAGGLTYIGQRYHDPIGAWAHETRFGWYDQGGSLYPGLTLVANGTGKTETVRTHEQEQAVQARLRTGYNAAGTMFAPAALPGYSMSSAGPTTAAPVAPQVTVNARVFVGDREITDIARVEAEGVVTGALRAIVQRKRANP